jgi:LL-diaminopimelate aminotransferase
MINSANRLSAINEYYFSAKLREIDAMNQAGKAVINLGIGSPDLPPHPTVLDTLRDAAAQPHNHAYQGYKGSPVLRRAIATWYATAYQTTLDPDQDILPLIGSKEGILHICMAFVNPGDTVWIPNPGYPTYRAAVTLADGICAEYALQEEQQWLPDLDALTATRGDRNHPRLMFVNYPHMPTGQLPEPAFFERLVQWAIANNVVLVHDNPYSFILNPQPLSLLSVPDAKRCVIELNSLSKSHNMAGWRVGMVCAAPEFINTILRFKSNMDSGMFLPVQLAAATALGLGSEWYNDLNAVYSQRRERVFVLLDTLNCRYSTTQGGMFVWAAIPQTEKDGYALSDRILYDHQVFITPGGIFGTEGNNYVRVSLCATGEKFDQAIARIKK